VDFSSSCGCILAWIFGIFLRSSHEKNFKIAALLNPLPPASAKSHIRKIIDEVTGKSFPRYFQYRFPIDIDDLLSLYARLEPSQGKSLYWEIPDESTILLAIGSVYEHEGSGPDRFTSAEEYYNVLKGRITVYREGEPADNRLPALVYLCSFFDTITDSEWNGFSPSLLYIPRIMIVKQESAVTASLTVPVRASSTVESVFTEVKQLKKLVQDKIARSSYSMPGDLIRLAPYLNGEKSQWIESVSHGIDSIRHHEIDKVVLAKRSRIAVQQPGTLFETIDTLRREYPECVTFLFREPTGKAFFGATPEWLARVHGNLLMCDALAGSIGRGDTPALDARLGEELLHSSKNLSEHKYVGQYLKRKLNELADNIHYPGSPSLKKLRNVQHLYTKITGDIKPGISPFDIIDALHPTPAVGGIPSKDALQFIRSIERLERGYYASPLGWLSLNGDYDLAVGLRSGLLTEDSLHLYAGAGIVEGSNPEAEYEELQLKLMPLLNAFQSAAIHE